MKTSKIFLNTFIMIFLFFNLSIAFPSRIISTMPSITEILFDLGLGDKIVGVTTNCDYPKEALKKEKIGQVSVNLEKILALKPDLIIMLYDAQKLDVERLKARRLPVVTINPHTVEDVLTSIKYIGELTGRKTKAAQLVFNLKRKLLSVSYNTEKNIYKKTVFVMVGYKPLVSAGKGTFIDDVIKKAGGINVITTKVAYPQINFEELYRLNPDIIIVPKGLASEAELKKENKISRLPAVQNGRINWIEPNMLFRPGPRIVDAILSISKSLDNSQK